MCCTTTENRINRREALSAIAAKNKNWRLIFTHVKEQVLVLLQKGQLLQNKQLLKMNQDGRTVWTIMKEMSLSNLYGHMTV